MKRVLFVPFVAVLSVLSASVNAGELISYQMEETVVEPVIPRPVRQTRYKDTPVRPHVETPAFFTLNGIDEELTQKAIDQYSSAGGRNWLSTILKRSEPYIGFIRAEVEKRGMPEEIIYLPVIESAFSVNAVSRAGATGLWQFMRNSVGPYDMRITEWVDERRDFWKSTIGALDKLQDNYKALGNWELALAAYNAGLGTVNNAIKKHGTKDYWELCRLKAFRNETIQYIPRLIAVTYMLSRPRRFGIQVSWPEDLQWARIPVRRAVDLKIVAEHAGLPADTLKKTNGELLYGITPPDPDYHIKVPGALAQSVAAILDDPSLTLIKYYFHTIRSGDTLLGIASRYGISVSQIQSQNPGLNPQNLKIGVRLVIPALSEITASASVSGTVSFAGTHLVKQGETLWSIALAYNTNPETLAQANNMGLNETLRVGRSLKTPSRASGGL
ncbi:MAG: transglycosylase SLT domain-containing protein [Treponema sp.]|jgi:membrane-bound lytic murein transglycosylase D|nr:transglycosylase SLT domain-containing protein [Treponema sp.]